MLEALAVDLDTTPDVSVIAKDPATVEAKGGIDVDLDVDLDFDKLLPEGLDLVQVDRLVYRAL